MNFIYPLITMIDKVISSVIKPFVVLISIAIASLLSFGIFTRSILNEPVFGLEELILMAAMWLYMLGAVLASKDRSHLSADFIQVFVENQKIISFMHLVATTISLIMASFFAVWSYDLMIWAFEKSQTTTVFQLPWYLSQSSLFVASALFIFYLVRDFFTDLDSFKNSDSK